MADKAVYRAPSVKRALSVLELVADSDQGLGISDLARRLEISKGTVFGICQQLEAGGALIRNSANKRYSLGPLVATLATRGFLYTRLREAAGPEMTKLRDQMGESVFLGIFSRGEVFVVDARQPQGRVGVSAGPGTRLPLSAGAVGKVIMAGLPPAQVDKLLARGLPAHTSATITDPTQYRRHLQQVREQGWAQERDEYLVGVWGVAVGLGAPGGVPAALWVVGFNSSLGEGTLVNTAQALVAAGRRIRRELDSLA